MKKVLIIALLCINAGLLLTLILGAGTPSAKAQAGAFLQTDFLAVPCQVGNTEDALFLIDLAKERLGALRVNIGTKKIVSYRYRSLAADFK